MRGVEKSQKEPQKVTDSQVSLGATVPEVLHQDGRGAGPHSTVRMVEAQGLKVTVQDQDWNRDFHLDSQGHALP